MATHFTPAHAVSHHHPSSAAADGEGHRTPARIHAAGLGISCGGSAVPATPLVASSPASSSASCPPAHNPISVSPASLWCRSCSSELEDLNGGLVWNAMLHQSRGARWCWTSHRCSKVTRRVHGLGRGKKASWVPDLLLVLAGRKKEELLVGGCCCCFGGQKNRAEGVLVIRAVACPFMEEEK
ncbi:hypothetical protein SETIT_2G053100v2 [Setaria italica]|uniref:Uncharacterized protein n=2 Tax=Setaria TaxID=4554 RepID=A0A368PW28_SETIT|nr:uncharacterized protein LOC101757104 [Setaria italica]RCV09734.1 hypothetical protein SETIT_2G053100v2 [Setaria italica]